MKDPLPLLRAFLAENPGLSPILGKVADRYHRRGALSGRQKLAHDARDHRLLCDLFGQDAIHRDKHDHLTLRYDRFFQRVEAEPWIAALHVALKRERTTAQDQARNVDQKVSRLLRAWQVAQPKRKAIHHWLALQRTALARRLEHQEPAQILAEWETVLRICDFLHKRQGTVALADLSARFTGHSKTLRAGRLLPQVAAWLAVTDGHLVPYRSRARRDLLESYGLLLNLTSVKVTLGGPLHYQAMGLEFDWIQRLWDLGQSATLSLDNLYELTGLTVNAPEARIITCENETPFVDLIREGRDLCIYTEGFPNGAVLGLLRRLAKSGRTFLHWGDSDLNGFRIAAQIAEVVPVKLWRCDLPELQRNREQLLPLEEGRRKKIQTFLEKNPDFPYAAELRFTLENGWLEQESWGL